MSTLPLRQWCAPDIDLIAEVLNGLIELSATIAADVRQVDEDDPDYFP